MVFYCHVVVIEAYFYEEKILYYCHWRLHVCNVKGLKVSLYILLNVRELGVICTCECVTKLRSTETNCELKAC